MVTFFHQVPVSSLTLYTLAFMIGIIGEHFIPYCFVIFSVITGWLLLFYLVSLNKKTAYFICSCFATTGAFYLQKYQSNWYFVAQQIAKKHITLVGTIINRVPSLNSKNCLQYTLYVTDSSEPLLQNSYIVLYVKNSKKLFDLSVTIRLKNIVCTLAPSHFAAYLIKEGFTAALYTSSSDIQRVYCKKSMWSYIYKTRFELLNWSKRLLSFSTHALFSSLFLGYKWNEPIEKYRETFSSFKFWGISHYIARSGLHLAILILLWHYILSYIPLRWYSKQLLSIVCSLFYLVCTWPSVSFLRALFSFIISRIFFCLKEPTHFLHVIALAAFCMLIGNPTLLFFLDFQLSFGMTFALVWLNNIPSLRKTLAK